MEVTIGGDRLGSGNKNKLALRNYERSTHNLSQRWTSSMQVGALYPFLVIPAMRGDTFEINLNADARTIPTKGPLFGSFKVQYDLFQCPWRLYQAILHNNPMAIGLKMSQVKLPQLDIWSKSNIDLANDPAKFKNNCLLKYLGISGIGQAANEKGGEVRRTFNALPILSYYDIYKNYYANKQEEDAYVISGGMGASYVALNSIKDPLGQEILIDREYYIHYYQDGRWTLQYAENIEKATDENILRNVDITFINENLDEYNQSLNEWNQWYEANWDGQGSAIAVKPFQVISKKNGTVKILAKPWSLLELLKRVPFDSDQGTLDGKYYMTKRSVNVTRQQLTLVPFKLAQLDDMRMALLSYNNMGTFFSLANREDAPGNWGNNSGQTRNGLPYSVLFRNNNEGITYNNLYDLNGLVIKTYQSDLYNNWVRTEWIDGDNGINAITAVSTADGSFQIDALNLAEKLYNMLNRVAVSDGTYEGWQDAVYTKSPRRHIESPVYLGGMSSEIVFEEIVQSAPADGEPLGTLAGKGRIMHRKGGRVVVKIDEASFIIGIVSITPRINYTQGNEWYMTDLKSMDDLHKPALDGIGFQNLLQEQMHYGACLIDEVSGLIEERPIAGKVPAWINYMTAVDKGFGDFAEVDGRGFMLLQRNYEIGERGIVDMTTYIDPTKYNYAFAYTDLSSQNFWVQIQSDIKARRLMSAKQIPNL